MYSFIPQYIKWAIDYVRSFVWVKCRTKLIIIQAPVKLTDHPNSILTPSLSLTLKKSTLSFLASESSLMKRQL